MLLTEKINTTWNTSNKKLLMSKGYEFTKIGDAVTVNFEDMSHGSDVFVEVKCDYCGKVYSKQIKKYYSHRSFIQTDCCVDCSAIKRQEARMKKYGTVNTFVTERAQRMHKERYAQLREERFHKIKELCKERDYTLLSTEYLNNCSDIEYICNKHKEKGTLKIKWTKLVNESQGCKYCGWEAVADTQRRTLDEVKEIVESSGKHKLISTEYTSYNDYNLEITCEECDNTFITSLSCFMGGRHLCSECNASSGERVIIDYLRANNIKYSHEHQIYIEAIESPYRFDFYLEQYNLAIEYDGEQHYEPINFNNEPREIVERNFRLSQRRDMLKDEHCKENNITLMRIPYWEKENISNILDDFFKSNSHKFIITTNIE